MTVFIHFAAGVLIGIVPHRRRNGRKAILMQMVFVITVIAYLIWSVE